MKPAYTEARPLVRRLSLIVPTKRSPQFIDITAEVQRKVAESGVQEGLALLFCRHTTAAVRINENEPLLIHDMEEFLKRVAPRDLYYRHNDFGIRTDNMTEDECPNAHAHCQHLLCPTCGRTGIDIPGIAEEVRARLADLDEPLSVAIMGCPVNGLGEAERADFAVLGGRGFGTIYAHGRVVRPKVAEERLADELVSLVRGEVTGR